MAQVGLIRPGMAQLRVTNMEASITHYVDRLGLEKVSQEDDGRVYLKGYTEFDRHSLVLRPADKPGLDMFAFKADSAASVENYRKRVEAFGLGVDEVSAGEMPGVGARIGFTTPTGHRIEIYAEMDLSEEGPMISNPEVWRVEPRGMRATRFDHAQLHGPDIPETERFFIEALDFSVPEHVKSPNGIVATWMSTSNKAHDIAFVHHDDPGLLHHLAFYLFDWSDVGHAADVMARYDIKRDLGPTRHGITNGQTIYFFDPSGNRNEVFAGGYTYYPDNPTRVWDPDHLGKGIFYYERELNEAFLTVFT